MNETLICNRQLSRKLTLAPNQSKRIPFSGSYISILSNTATVDALVSVDSGGTTPVKAGIGFPTVKQSPDKTSLIPSVFSYVDFINPSNSETMVLEYTLALGELRDTRSVVQGYLQMDLSAPVIETPAALVVATDAFSILPSNTLVKERIVQNTGDYPIWWGDENTNPATGQGGVINPGGAAVINCWGVIYFKAEGGESRLSVNNILKVS